MPQDNYAQNSTLGQAKRALDLIDFVGYRLSMGSRKKSKVNPALESESDTQSQKHTAQNDVTESAARQDYLQTEDTSEATRERTEPIKISRSHGPVAEAGGQSWYGSWKNKALPVTEVRRESISASPRPSLTSGSSKASIKYNSSGTGNASPHRYMSTGSLRGTKATPMEATTTNISITSKKSLKNETETVRNTSREASDPPIPPESSAKETYSKTSRSGTKQMAQNPIVSDTTEASTPIVGWLGGWWSRPDGFDDSKTKQTDNEAAVAAEAKNTPLPESVPVPKDSDRRTRSPDDPVLVNEESTRNVSTSEQKDKVPATTSKSWFSFWSTSQNAQIFETREETPEIGVHDTRTTSPNTDATRLATDGTDSDSKSIRSINATIKSVKDIGSRKASGWAFWSLGNTDPTVTINVDGMNKQVGELAVANTPSQSSPEQAQFNSSAVEDVPAESIKSSSSSAVSSKTRKTAVKSKNKIKQQEDTVEQITPLESSEPKVNKPPTKARDTKSSETTIALSKIDSHKSDIILPDLRKTYSVEQKHTMLQNLRHYVLGDGPQDHPHLHMVSSLPKIKKALAIGVHGFFPNSLFQKVMGAPTGTSIKFSNMAATAIKKWTQSQGYDCEIEKAALEGEGLIADRVDTLWKLLLNWIDHVRSADFVLFACHSQGVPVTVMLVDRLIKFGILSSKKVGICAMAGINLGPWKEYRTQLLGKSALELFDFASPSSKVSTSYRTALDQVLRHNVRITFVGSMDDQLVSLESSTFSNISHPCIYRAVFIDGRHYSSDFITELCGFALKLRNLGISDHGLIRELSPALAGSLYTGEGHSRLYEHVDVYSLAVSHTLETTSPSINTPVIIADYEEPPNAKDSNPYFLPWAMRGILEEEKVRKELSNERAQLLSLFDSWKPNTKLLKDVRFRLEALKSKL